MHVAYLLNTGGHARRHREAFARIFDSDLEPNRKYLGFSLFAMEFRNLSLSLSLDLPTRSRARERDRERKKESRCAEKEDLSRRDVVLTSVSRRRGPRDLDNRSRRARQGRVTVHRMKVTRIIHGPVFLFSKIERRPRGISPIGNLDLVSPFIFRSRGYAKKGKVLARASTNIIRPVFENSGMKGFEGFSFLARFQ